MRQMHLTTAAAVFGILLILDGSGGASGQDLSGQPSPQSVEEKVRVAEDVGDELRRVEVETRQRPGKGAYYHQYQKALKDLTSRLERLRVSHSSRSTADQISNIEMGIQLSIVKLMDLAPHVDGAATEQLVDLIGEFQETVSSKPAPSAAPVR